VLLVAVDPTAEVTRVDASTGGTGVVPGEVLNLTNWKLQLPVGGPDEVLQPELATFIRDPWFKTRWDGGVQFRARVDGATTPGSSYPRSELRQMAGAQRAAWSLADRHRLRMNVAVTAAPGAKPHVVVAQIHQGEDDILQVLYDGTRKAITYRVDGVTVGSLVNSYRLGQRFDLGIDVDDNRVALSINGTRRARFAHAGSMTAHWKAGAYVLSNPSMGDSPETYGEAVVYSLTAW
jgi:hypothetical protein